MCGWKHGLHARPSDAKAFDILIAAFTTPLMLLIMRMTGNPAIMGEGEGDQWRGAKRDRTGNDDGDLRRHRGTGRHVVDVTLTAHPTKMRGDLD